MAIPIGTIIFFSHEFIMRWRIALIMKPTVTAAIPYKIDFIVLKPLYFFQYGKSP